MRRLKSLTLLFGLATAPASCLPDEPAAGTTPLHPAPEGAVRVEVHFGTPLAVRSAAGFLHGVGASEPHDSLVRALRPAMWRIGDPDRYARLVRTFPDAASRPRITFVLSDQWGYPSYPGGDVHGWPYEDWEKWEAFVRAQALRHRDKGLLWEVWNEPDVKPRHWDGTPAQFRETYLRAYRILREVLGPQAMIGGPGFSSFDAWTNPQGLNTRALMRDFLEFCSQQELRGRAAGAAPGATCGADFLTWHELHADVRRIGAHLEEVRALAKEYPAVGVRELHVGETVGEVGHRRPADQLATLHYLEQGRADAAAKGCWNDADGELTCFDDDVDGLLTRGGSRKAAGWWVYKLYADGVETRVRSTTGHPLVVALGSAGTPSARQAQVLVAYADPEDRASPVPLRVALRGIDSLPFRVGATVAVTTHRIPSAGESPVDAPEKLASSRHPVRNGSVELVLAGVRPHDAYLLTVQP